MAPRPFRVLVWCWSARRRSQHGLENLGGSKNSRPLYRRTIHGRSDEGEPPCKWKTECRAYLRVRSVS